MIPSLNRPATITAACVFTGFPFLAHAQTPLAWDGGASDGEYTSGLNWAGDSVPADDLTSNIAQFTGGSVTLSSNRSVAGLDFESATNFNGSGILTLGASGVEVNGNSFLSTAGVVINNDIAITLAGGRLSWGSGTIVSGTGKTTITGNNTLFVDGTSNTYTGGTDIIGGSTASVRGGNSLGAGLINLDNGTLSGNGGANMTFDNGFTLGTGGGTMRTSSGRFSITNPISGNGGLTVEGAGGIVFLDTANSFSGAVRIKGAGNLGVKQNSLGDASATNNLILEDGGSLFGNSANLDMAGRDIQLLGTGGRISSAAGRSVFNNNGVISGDGQLAIGGGGTVQITGNSNTYTGGTRIEGALQAQSNGSLGDASGALIFNGGSLKNNNSNINLGNRDITLEGDGTLISGWSNRAVTHSGNLSGAGKLTIGNDSSTVRFSGDYTHTGGTDIIGTLWAGNNLGTGDILLDSVTNGRGKLQNWDSHTVLENDISLGANGGALQAGWNKSLTINGTVSGSSDLTISNDSGTVVLGGTNTHTGGIILDGNAKLRVTGSLGSGAYAGEISGSGSLEYAGSGTQTLTGNSSYTGASTITLGTLNVDGDMSSSSGFTVESGATIGGSGTVGDLTIEAGAFHNPGNSPGIMSTGNYLLSGTIITEIEGNFPGAGGHDQVDVTGTVDITGASLTTLFSSGSYAEGDMLFIILNDGTDAITGTFSGLAQGDSAASFGGLDWLVSYSADGDSGGSPTFTGGNDFALMAVPEPSIALLGSLGVLCLLRRRRP